MTSRFEFDLPWPPRELSPNSRSHYMARARAIKKYRAACAAITRAAVGCGRSELSRPVVVVLTFRPPRRGRFDLDNLVARMKAGLDGVADALGVDDAEFRLTVSIAAPCPPAGCVGVGLG